MHRPLVALALAALAGSVHAQTLGGLSHGLSSPSGSILSGSPVVASDARIASMTEPLDFTPPVPAKAAPVEPAPLDEEPARPAPSPEVPYLPFVMVGTVGVAGSVVALRRRTPAVPGF